MKNFRHLVPVLGLFSLIALFLLLPEAPGIGCKTCSSKGPYIPLIGSGYFSALIAISLLFPSFPRPLMARGGLTWSVLLALALTYINLPSWCGLCLIGHICNILIWTIWLIVPPEKNKSGISNGKERLCMLLFAPISVVALFSCLNLTFMAYGVKKNGDAMATSLQIGQEAPRFTAKTIEGEVISNTDAKVGKIILNFVSPGCPHCKEQLQVLNTFIDQLSTNSCRFINVSSFMSANLVVHSPNSEWVDDSDDNLFKLFKVSGYPMLVVIGTDGKIVQVISGVPEHFKAKLMASLSLP